MSLIELIESRGVDKDKLLEALKKFVKMLNDEELNTFIEDMDKYGSGCDCSGCGCSK